MPEIDLVGIAAATTIDSAHVVDGGLVVRCDRCRAEICDVEVGDTLHALALTARDHLVTCGSS